MHPLIKKNSNKLPSLLKDVDSTPHTSRVPTNLANRILHKREKSEGDIVEREIEKFKTLERRTITQKFIRHPQLKKQTPPRQRANSVLRFRKNHLARVSPISTIIKRTTRATNIIEKVVEGRRSYLTAIANTQPVIF